MQGGENKRINSKKRHEGAVSSIGYNVTRSSTESCHSNSSSSNASSSSNNNNNNNNTTTNGSIKKPENKLKKIKKSTEKKSIKKNLQSRFLRPYHILGFVCAILVSLIYFNFFSLNFDKEFPCHCCISGGSLISAISSKRFGLSGIHLERKNNSLVEEELANLPECVKLHRITLPFKSVTSFLDRLRMDVADTNCIIWLIEDIEVIRGVANSLKELLDDNSLRGEIVLPTQSRALFVLVSEKSREELKDILPHRVVHMFRTIIL